MKWMVFVLSALGMMCAWRSVEAKPPRTVTLSEADVATVRTALGYTTLLNFDGRPTSAVLGDQDAFKVEYVGNGLAIKPLHGGARTNLFVFTDYDRFNFRLVAGAAVEAEYLLRIRRPGLSSFPVQGKPVAGMGVPLKLTRREINRRAACGGLTLGVLALAWPESRSTVLVQFRAEATELLVKGGGRGFQPGDFELRQGKRLLPIESLHVDRLSLGPRQRVVQGTLVVRQSEILPGRPLELAFLPDFLKPKHAGCPKVVFTLKGGS